MKLTEAQKRLLARLLTHGRLAIWRVPYTGTLEALVRRGLAEVRQYYAYPTEKAKEIASEVWFVRFTVPGSPVPKARPRLGKGRVYTPSPTKGFERAVGFRARTACKVPTTMPVKVRLLFYVRHRRADLDNLVKAVLDGMRGVVYHDDRQVVEIAAKVIKSEKEMTAVEVEIAG